MAFLSSFPAFRLLVPYFDLPSQNWLRQSNNFRSIFGSGKRHPVAFSPDRMYADVQCRDQSLQLFDGVIQSYSVRIFRQQERLVAPVSLLLLRQVIGRVVLSVAEHHFPDARFLLLPDCIPECVPAGLCPVFLFFFYVMPQPGKPSPTE